MKYFRATIEFEWDNHNSGIKQLESVLRAALKLSSWPKLQVTKIEVEQIGIKINER